MVVSRAMRESNSYESMSPTAKVLMDLLQMQWRNDRPVAYVYVKRVKRLDVNLKPLVKRYYVATAQSFTPRKPLI